MPTEAPDGTLSMPVPPARPRLDEALSLEQELVRFVMFRANGVDRFVVCDGPCTYVPHESWHG